MNFYRRFIKNFAKIAKPLTGLARKDNLRWTAIGEHAFQPLNNAFCEKPIIAHFDPDKPSVVETDASDCATWGVFSRYGTDGLLHPVAYFSRKFIPQQVNYDIYDKELLAIISCFENWRAELEGGIEAVRVLCDHKNLEYFMTTKKLSRRQARWAKFLSYFNFKIDYRPGRQGTKPDALTRRPGDLPKTKMIRESKAKNRY